MITKQILKDYRYNLMENADLEKRIHALEEKLKRYAEEGNVVDVVSGGEGGIQHFRIEGFPSRDYSKAKTRLQMQIVRYKANQAFLDDVAAEVEEFFESLEDSCTRLIFRKYFEDGMSQEEISDEINLDQSVISRKINFEINKLA